MLFNRVRGTRYTTLGNRRGTVGRDYFVVTVRVMFTINNDVRFSSVLRILVSRDACIRSQDWIYKLSIRKLLLAGISCLIGLRPHRRPGRSDVAVRTMRHIGRASLGHPDKPHLRSGVFRERLGASIFSELRLVDRTTNPTVDVVNTY